MDLTAEEFQKLQDRLDVVLDRILWGKSVSDIARERGRSRPTIREWIKRFEADGLHGLLDSKRSSGRPRKIPQFVRDEIIRLKLETRPPSDLNYDKKGRLISTKRPREERGWTTRLLAGVFKISASHVENIWKEAGIDPPQHLQQVRRNPFRRVQLKIDLQVPAWVKLNLDLTLKEHDWTLEQHLLARLVDVDPGELQADLDELYEETYKNLPERWNSLLDKLPEDDPRSVVYQRNLKRRTSAIGRLTSTGTNAKE